MKSILTGAIALTLLAGTASADMVVAGDHNGWNNADAANTMTEIAPGSGLWYHQITGLTAGDVLEFKVVRDLDWNDTGPTTNARYTVDADGIIDVWAYTNPADWADGWEPSAPAHFRVGWEDDATWEVIGDFNGWASGSVTLVDNGFGVLEGTLTGVSEGIHQMKFREAGTWASGSIGDDFGASAANIEVDVTAGNDTINFSLDMKKGRYMITVVPAPGAAMLMGIGGLMVAGRRRG